MSERDVGLEDVPGIVPLLGDVLEELNGTLGSYLGRQELLRVFGRNADIQVPLEHRICLGLALHFHPGGVDRRVRRGVGGLQPWRGDIRPETETPFEMNDSQALRQRIETVRQIGGPLRRHPARLEAVEYLPVPILFPP